MLLKLKQNERIDLVQYSRFTKVDKLGRDRESEEPKERKKLELKPRTVDAPKEGEGYKTAKVNPFGEAKPRDETAALKKIEDERKARETTEKVVPKEGEEPTTDVAPKEHHSPKQHREGEKKFYGENRRRDDRP